MTARSGRRGGAARPAAAETCRPRAGAAAPLANAEAEDGERRSRPARRRSRTPPVRRRATATSGPWRPADRAACRPRRAPAAGHRRRRAALDGVTSATRASRGAPRMPLPSRSTKRASRTQPALAAIGEQDLGQAAETVAQQRQLLAPADPIAEHAGEQLGDRGRALRHRIDQRHHGDRGAELRHQITRQQAINDGGTEVGEQADKAEQPDRAVQGAEAADTMAAA